MNAKLIITGLTLLLIAIILSINANAYYIDTDLTFSTNCLQPSYKNFNLVNDTHSRKHYIISANGSNSSWLNINGKYIFFEPLNFYLNAGERKELTLFVVPNCDTEKGLYNIMLTIREDNKEYTETVKAFVTQLKNVFLSTENNNILVEKCNERTFNLIVKNNSPFNEKIKLYTEGYTEQLISFTENPINLKSNEEKKITVKIKAPCYIKAEEKTLKITAIIEGTALMTTKEVTLKIMENKEQITETKETQENTKEKPTAFLILNESNSWFWILLLVLLTIITLTYLYNKGIIATPSHIQAEKRTMKIIKQLEN